MDESGPQLNVLAELVEYADGVAVFTDADARCRMRLGLDEWDRLGRPMRLVVTYTAAWGAPE